MASVTCRALRALACVALGLCAQCGFSDAGAGSQTLGIDGKLRCSYPAMQTATVWRLRDAHGQAVTAAQVVLTDADSRERVEVPEQSEAGTYALMWPGYHRRVRAHIVRGADFAHFSVEGPSPHVLTAPTPGIFVKGAGRLDVRWKVPDGVRADRVDVHLDPELSDWGEVQSERAGGTVSRDAGRARVHLADIEQGPHTLHVARTASLSPTGAQPGGLVESTYVVQTAFSRQ